MLSVLSKLGREEGRDGHGGENTLTPPLHHQVEVSGEW